ncbi:MAG: triose-phosphate isomerase family protein [Aristaeellaceae bacterium]
MKHIYLNLKRFDITPERGGVNRLAPMAAWGGAVVRGVEAQLRRWPEAEYVMYLPEAHLLGAAAARTPGSPVKLGSQSVYRQDTAVGGNFGAFTTNRTANAVREMGCESTLIGHCEERGDKLGILAEGGVTGEAAAAAVNRLLNQEIRAAQAAGLSVLYCIGERSEEQERWQEVLGAQLAMGLDGVDRARVVIAYEPVWSIGPGKTPADRPYIEKIARFVKERTGGMDVVYGGGLKQDNAAMLASIPEIDGGLIALTRFQGEIGFYPEEYLDIIRRYLGKEGTQHEA